jgi:HupE/UreJ protein
VRFHGLVESTRRRFMALAVLVCTAVPNAAAHDIPTDVKINAFIKPAGNRLELLIRVPLAAMIEVDFPKRGPGYLDISRADEALHNAAKLYLIDNITVTENGEPLPAPSIVHARVSLASDRSFTSYEAARAHVEGPRLADDLELYWNQQLLDVLLEYPIRSDRSEFAIDPRVDRFGQNVSTALRFLPPAGATRAFELHGNPGLVRLDPRWHQAALRFVESGFWHILQGTDHLLFLLCLVIPFRRLRPLVIIVTSFTVGHSISLVASAFGFVPDALWFPPLIETLIAVTIVYMALENIVYAAIGCFPAKLSVATGMASAPTEPGAELSRRWIIAFAFGIVRLLVCAARISAVRGGPSRHRARRVQYRRRARPDRRAARAGPGARAAVQVCRPGAARHYPSVGAGGAHRLALADRAWRAVGEIPVSEARRRIPRERNAWVNGGLDPGRSGFIGERLAEALDPGGWN